MRKLILALMLSVFLLGFGTTAMADTILFPYLNTDAGVYSFVTIVNDGYAEYGSIVGYHFVYGYKANPIVNTAGCFHSNHNVVTTPSDMMTFEVNGKIDDAGTDVLFENAGDGLGIGPGGLTSTTWLLNVANQTAFLIVEPLGVVEADDDLVRMWGWAEVIDTANNLTLAYSTQNLANDISGDDLGNIGANWVSLSWYPTAFVTTSWHVLPLDDALRMTPPAVPGGMRALFLAWNGVSSETGAFNRDEVFTSGARRVPIRCFGRIDRTNLFEGNLLNETVNGGWAYFGSSDPAAGNVTLLATDPVDPLGVYTFIDPVDLDQWNILVNKIQTATAAAGVGTRTAIAREPQWDGFPYAP